MAQAPQHYGVRLTIARRYLSDVDRAAAAPGDVAVTGQEAVVDEVAPQRRGVRVERAKVGVDLAFRVAHADLEDTADVVEHDEPLAVLRRDLGEPPTAQERAQHTRRLPVDVADVVRLLARPRLLRNLPQPPNVEPPVRVDAGDQSGRVQLRQRLERAALRQPSGFADLVSRAAYEHECGDDPD